MLKRLTLLAALMAAPLHAQDFNTVIAVGDRAVTGWELDQRTRLLEAFGEPDPAGAARTQLVEDRLKQIELDRRGVTLSDEGYQAALVDFAARASLTPEEFQARLAAEGVAPESLRDYLRVAVAWRDYVGARFGSRVEVTDAEVDARLARDQVQAAGVEVLLSEIIIPAPPGQEASALATATAIAGTRSTAEFEAAARRVSATPTRDRGGRLDWQPVTNFPPALQALLLGLAPGGVTQPLQLPGAVALLQLRDVREAPVAPAEPESIDYALVGIPGGLSAPALAEAARLAASADTCDDLYVVAPGVARQSVAPGEVPGDVALQLATLDADEATWGLTRDGGATLLFVMLCGRTYPLPEGSSRDDVATAIRGEKLEAYSALVLADLRAATVIVGE